MILVHVEVGKNIRSVMVKICNLYIENSFRLFFINLYIVNKNESNIVSKIHIIRKLSAR